MNELKTENEWREQDRETLFKLSQDYSLRTPKQIDREWRITSYSRKHPDHIFGGYKEGFGLSIYRETKKKFCFQKRFLMESGFEIKQEGDLEGNFYAKDHTLALTIAERFKFKKNGSRGQLPTIFNKTLKASKLFNEQI